MISLRPAPVTRESLTLKRSERLICSYLLVTLPTVRLPEEHTSVPCYRAFGHVWHAEGCCFPASVKGHIPRPPSNCEEGVPAAAKFWNLSNHSPKTHSVTACYDTETSFLVSRGRAWFVYRRRS